MIDHSPHTEACWNRACSMETPCFCLGIPGVVRFGRRGIGYIHGRDGSRNYIHDHTCPRQRGDGSCVCKRDLQRILRWYPPAVAAATASQLAAERAMQLAQQRAAAMVAMTTAADSSLVLPPHLGGGTFTAIDVPLGDRRGYVQPDPTLTVRYQKDPQ